MSDFYAKWGFFGDPFQTVALGPNRQGRQLLIGREQEIKKVKSRLHTAGKITCVEGVNGVGKTSLVNVAAFSCFEEYLSQKKGQLLIPCRTTFQLTNSANHEDFLFQVLLEVAQTLLDRRAEVNIGSMMENSDAIDRWLNSAQTKSWQGGIPGLSAGAGTQGNEGAGFQQSGFARQVKDWLKEIFPNQMDGGVVCVIDNMELLETSAAAKKTMEALRDPLLTIQGLRWVICGANGITQSLVSSPRLEGCLTPVVDIDSVNRNYARDILSSRVTGFSYEPRKTYLPIEPEDFERLHQILNLNLRSLLNRVHSFCQYVADSFPRPPETLEQKRSQFDLWLKHESTEIVKALDTQLTPRAWEVFDLAARDFNGKFSPSDFAKFNCQNMQALAPFVKQLEDVDLLSSIRQESDRRRKMISITPKGWLAYYGRIVKP